VGKSSLINKLLGERLIKTGSVSSYSGRGKHITTSREMYFLPARQSLGAGGENGGIVIDNPGVREVGMTDVIAGINDIFDEINALAKNCKYNDCTHMHEPGCAVLKAVESGELDESKYSNYISLKKEAQYYEMNEMEKKEKDRQFGKFVNKMKKGLKEVGHKDW
jgi:ribosome biogenesis GTPase